MSKLLSLLQKSDAIGFFNIMNYPAYIVDTDRRIVLWNKRAQQLMGYSPDQVIGKKCSDNVLNHIDRTGICVCTTSLCPLYQAMKTGTSFLVPFAVYGLTSSGKRIPLSVIGIPIRDENGEVVGAIEMFSNAQQMDRDLTMAIKIQQSFVPRNNEFAEFFYRPSSGLGGDLIYYRYPWIGILDVSGHGVASALVAMLVRSLLEKLLTSEIALYQLPILLEREWQNCDFEDIYFTGIVGKIVQTKFVFVNMGHPNPIALDQIEPIDTKSTPPIGLGLIQEVEKDWENVFDLTRNELLLITDGVLDIQTKNGLLGYEGIAKVVGPRDSLDTIYLKLIALSESPMQSDDITMVKLRKRD